MEGYCYNQSACNKMQYELLSILPRSTSCNNNKIIVPASPYAMSSIVSEPDPTQKSINHKTHFRFSAFFQSILTVVFPISHVLIPTRRWLPTTLSLPTPSLRRKLTGTLFGHRRGYVTFSIQNDPRSAPVLIIQLAITTANLVKEMSSGLVRIALESDKTRGQPRKLFNEPTWSMYCNGKKCGYNAISRACNESDWHVLSMVGSVSAGAGVIPVIGDGRKGTESEGELMYMRAKFERVVGSRDSEAFYMMNPDGNGGPELSIFLLRI